MATAAANAVLNREALNEDVRLPSSKYSRTVEDKKNVVGKNIQRMTFKSTPLPICCITEITVAPSSMVNINEARLAIAMRVARGTMAVTSGV